MCELGGDEGQVQSGVLVPPGSRRYSFAMSRTSPVALVLALVLGCGSGSGSGDDTTTNNSNSTGGETAAPGTGEGTTSTSGTSGTSGDVAPTTGAGTTSGTETSVGTTQADETGTTGSVTTATSGGESCSPGYSAGCCFGDGECCPCVGFACEIFADGAAIEAFQQCTCQQGVCADACEVACAGDGIDLSCFICAQKSAQGECKEQFAACDGSFEYTCDAEPVSCEECESCSISGACYDAWFACWQDEGGCQDIIIGCEPGCADTACLQKCADDAPAGGQLYQAWLNCTYCDSCSSQCGGDGVQCN